MKLSEAIRLGAMLKPQAFGDYTDGIGTCALGAACEAISVGLRDNGLIKRAEDAWERELPTVDRRCRFCGVTVESPLHLVTHLNDWHRWTREQIADLIEMLESSAPTKAKPVAESVTK